MAVVHQNYAVVGDGVEVEPRVNRQGSYIAVDQVLQWTIEGRVFNASNIVQEVGELAGESGGPGSDNVTPSFLLEVPSGITAVFLEMYMQAEGTGTSADWTVLRMSTDTVARYASGGDAVTPRNMRKHGTSARCRFFTGGTAIVAAVNTDDDTIWASHYDVSLLPQEAWHWTYRDSAPVVLVGPAAVLTYVDVSNVDEEINFSQKWAEFATSEVV